MNSSENPYLNQHPQEYRADDSRPMKDSPIPKLTHSRCEPSAGREDPISPIEEEDSVEDLSKKTTPTKALHEISLTAGLEPKTNEIQSPSSQSYKQRMDHNKEPSENSFIFKSAQRVRINESGEQVVDISWTEFKKKYKENFSSKISTPTQTNNKDLKLSMSQNKSPIRRSKRLADIKSQTCDKRKAVTETKKIKKIKR